MRPNERYVLRALIKEFGGQCIEGEDPPDAYILNGNKRIAVEVSALVEQLQDENGKLYSRLNDDAPAKNLAEKIESDIGENIPYGTHIFLVLKTPIRQIRKTQALIGDEIIKMIKTGDLQKENKFLDNDISISVFTGWGDYTPKIGCAISTRYSSSNIYENTKRMLGERIETKNKKRNIKPDNTEYWLALFNHYWIADEESYQLAYRSLGVEHDFDKILIVNGYQQVYVLNKTSQDGESTKNKST